MKSVYMFQNALEQAKVELPGPKAYAKPPQRPLKTVSPAESSPDTFSSYQSGMNKSSPTAENSNGSFFKSIQDVLSGVKGHVLGVLVEVKEHVFASFAGMALPFGMVAWYQFRYLDHLRGKTIAQRLRSMVPRVVSRIAAQEGLIKELGKAVDRLEEVANLAMSMVVEERKAHKATVDDLKRQRATDADTILGLTEKVQSIIQKHEATATQAGKHLEAAEEKASQAEEKLAEAATLAETSEQKILQLESKKSSLTDSLIKSSNALAEAVSNAKKAGEDAKKTEKALQEQVAELIKQHNENAAQSTARNTKLQDELDREKEARLGLISNDESPRVKDAEEGQQRAEEAARRAKGEAAHLVRSQAGQLNRAKAMNDAYRARYGKLDEDKTVDTSTATASSANATSSTPSKNQVRNDGDSTKEASGGSSQGSTEVVSSHSATASVSQTLQCSTYLTN